MKKQLLLATALLAAASVSAQDIEEVIIDQPVAAGTSLNSNFKNNWFISVGAGPQVFFGDHDRQRKFGQRISPALDVAVGKWVTPVVGVRLMYSGLYAKGATQNGVFSNGKPIEGKPWHGYWLEESKFDFMNLHGDVLFDLTNWIGGYNPKRVYGIALYVGVGYGRTWSTPHNDAVSGNVGLFNMFHLPKGFDINLDIHGTAFHDGFDGQNGNRVFDGLVSVTAGLTYNFAPRGWKGKYQTVTVYDNDAVNNLRAEVQGLVAQNEKLEREIKEGKDVKRVVVEKVAGNYIVYFPINVSELSRADRAQLDMCSQAIKESDGQKFMITGYADKATGNAEINEILSRARAESVRSCLVNEFGIPANRLEISWKGGVGNMFYNDPALSRVVIISPVKK